MTTNDQLTTVSPAHAGPEAPTVARDPWAETAGEPTTATEVVTAPRDDTAILTPMAASPFPATAIPAETTSTVPADPSPSGTTAAFPSAGTEPAPEGLLESTAPDDPAPMMRTEAKAATSSVPADPVTAAPAETPPAVLPGVGALPPAGPPPGQWQVPPPAAGRPRITKSPKLILIAAVLVTAIASSGITAGIMSALGGGTPAVTTQDGTTTQQQDGSVPGFGGGPGGGGMPGDGGFGGGPGGMQQDSSGTQQQGSDTEQGTQPDSGTQQQGTTDQQSTTGT